MGFDFSTASDSTTNPLSYFSDRGEDYEKYQPIHPGSAIDTILSGLQSPAQLVAPDIGGFVCDAKLICGYSMVH